MGDGDAKNALTGVRTGQMSEPGLEPGSPPPPPMLLEQVDSHSQAPNLKVGALPIELLGLLTWTELNWRYCVRVYVSSEVGSL